MSLNVIKTSEVLCGSRTVGIRGVSVHLSRSKGVCNPRFGADRCDCGERWPVKPQMPGLQTPAERLRERLPIRLAAQERRAGGYKPRRSAYVNGYFAASTTQFAPEALSETSEVWSVA
jgi:hypothetical protein